MLCPSAFTETPYRANSGGPCSRGRTAQIRATLLGRTEGPILCPRHLCLALDFGDRNPVTTAYGLLRAAGFHNPEGLRQNIGLPLGPMVCQVTRELQPLEVASADPLEVLRQAFLLGLCTTVRFEPDRPVLWTQASLTRRLEVFDIREFYA